MTAQELISKFNNEFGLDPWPKCYIVDHETYANVCQFIFDELATYSQWINIAIGYNNGIMFKNVELILEGRTDNVWRIKSALSNRG